jgi:hypothetical protein
MLAAAASLALAANPLVEAANQEVPGIGNGDV